jgi:hypothetical protein
MRSAAAKEYNFASAVGEPGEEASTAINRLDYPAAAFSRLRSRELVFVDAVVAVSADQVPISEHGVEQLPSVQPRASDKVVSLDSQPDSHRPPGL